jgi:acyl-CoA thioester hydrolase
MSDFNFSIPIQPRYTDFDMLGHLNNATYVTYFEVARLHYFMAIGWTLKDVSNVVAHIDIDFLLPVLPGDKVKCGIKTISLGTKSFQMHYELLSVDNKKCYAHANSVQVCIDKKEGKAILMPQNIRSMLTNFEKL